MARPQSAVAPANPAATLARYRDALEHDDPKAAYALLTEEAQQGLPYEQFAQQWQDTKPERSKQAAELRQLLTRGGTRGATGQSAGVTARAVVTLPQGAQLILAPAGDAGLGAVGKSSAWRILDPDLQIVRAQTPEAALRLLLAAAEQRNYPALLRLLTKSERQNLEAELLERVERLRQNLARGQPIEPSGEHARVQYDPRFFIDLKRESDGWRIADFN